MRWILWIVMGMFWAGVAVAGSITAEIDKNRSSMDEPFWLTVGIQGSLDGEVIVPETKDFEIVRTGESTNISIINGSMTKERQYTFQVRALKEGRLTIPSLKAKVDDQELSTESFVVDVKGGAAPAPDGGAVGSGQALVLVERDLPKNILFEGEVVVSKVRLLTRARLTGATPARDAAPDWRLISVDGQKNSEVTRDGARWNAIELTEALIPLKSGRLKAPPFGINASWIAPVARRKTPRSVFDMFQQGMFNTGEEVSKKVMSEPVDVTVKPLPSPRPTDFGDMVGAFRMTAQVSKRELGVGETATVTVEIKGQGALDRAKELKLVVPGAKIYADKPSLTENVEPAAGLVSKRVMKFAVVPTAGGAMDLGTIKLSAFNPFTETYETLTAELGTLKVAGGDPNAAKNVGQEAKAEGEQTNHNQTSHKQTHAADAQSDTKPAAAGAVVLAPRDVSTDMPTAKPWYRTTLALAIEFLMLAVIIAMVVIRRIWRHTKRHDTVSPDPIQSTVDAAILALERDGAKAFHDGVHALKSVLAKKGQDPHAMTSAEMLHAAESAGFNADFVSQLRQVLTEMDLMDYGGRQSDALGAQSIRHLRELLQSCIAGRS